MQLAATHLASTVVLFIWAAFFISFFFFSSVSSCFLNSNPASCLHHKHFFLRWYKLEIWITQGASDFQLTSFTLIKYIKRKGPTIWLLRGVWVISEKKNPADRFWGKKLLQGNNWQKNPYTEKIYFTAYNAGKKNLTPLHVRKKFYYQRFEEKIITQTKTHIPLSKVKWSASKLNSKNELIINKQYKRSRNKKMLITLSYQELRKI